MPTITCQRCGTERHEKPSRILDGKGKFCSKKCQYSAHTLSTEERRARIRESRRAYCRQHPGRRKASVIAWRVNHPEKYREVVRKNRIQTDRTRATRRLNYRKNRAKMVRKQALFRSKKIKIDPDFALLCKLRSRVKGCIKNNPLTTRPRTIALLGCTIRELRDHLERQFVPGMTWQNHGISGWHIDHIMPCCSFDLSNPEHQRKCFHFSNLQPLWAADNISKGGKLAHA